MKNVAIEFRDVVKTFTAADGRKQTVLDAVSFTIPAGKTTVIAGGSGQGKSVALKLVLGLMRVLRPCGRGSASSSKGARFLIQ